MVIARKLGFLVSDLGNNWLARTLMLQAHELYGGGSTDDIVLFFQNAALPVVTPPFACMNIAEAFDFDGCVVATSVYTAECLARFPGPTRRLFYAWDLEWMRGIDRSYAELRSVYAGHLPVYARSHEHASIIENCWNTRVCRVIEDASLTSFLELAVG